MIVIQKDVYALACPGKATITDETIKVDSEKHHRVGLIKNIKKVIDIGEWYHIKFSFWANCFYFVCQKDLITQGTIEEFENLFEGKIVHKKY